VGTLFIRGSTVRAANAFVAKRENARVAVEVVDFIVVRVLS
jgi:hypothetical protein